MERFLVIRVNKGGGYFFLRLRKGSSLSNFGISVVFIGVVGGREVVRLEGELGFR